jgi:hypothetical protein
VLRRPERPTKAQALVLPLLVFVALRDAVSSHSNIPLLGNLLDVGPVSGDFVKFCACE